MDSGLFLVSAGPGQRTIPSSLHIHHHCEKRPCAGGHHEGIAVCNSEVLTANCALAPFLSLRPTNKSDLCQNWTRDGISNHTLQRHSSIVRLPGRYVQARSAIPSSTLSSQGGARCSLLPEGAKAEKIRIKTVSYEKRRQRPGREG